jgi:hypothetical protein
MLLLELSKFPKVPFSVSDLGLELLTALDDFVELMVLIAEVVSQNGD